MIGKIFFWLGLTDKEGPIEFIETKDTSFLPIYKTNES